MNPGTWITGKKLKSTNQFVVGLQATNKEDKVLWLLNFYKLNEWIFKH